MQKIIRNIIYSILGFSYPLLLTLFTLPYIVRGLGDSLYGIWLLIGNLMGYMGIFNSMQAAGTKYLSEYIALKDYISINKLLSSTFIFNIGIGILGGLGLFVSASPLALDLFHVPANLQNDAIFAFRLAGFGFCLNTIGWWGSSVLNGLQRYDMSNSILMFVVSFSTIGSFVVVILGGGIIEIVAVNIFGGLITAFLYFWNIARLLPEVNLRLRIDFVEFKKIFSFGVFIVFQMMLGVIMTQMDRTLLGIWIGVEAVTIYSIPSIIAQRIHSLCSKSLETIFPISSGLSTQGRSDELKRLFLRSQNLNNVLVIGISTPIYMLAGEILKYWISPDFAIKGTVVFRLLIIAYALLALTAPISFIVNGLGHPEMNTGFSLLIGISNLIGYIIFIPRWGVEGAGVASVIGSVVSVPIYLWYLNRKFLRVPWYEIFTSAFFRPLAAGTAIVLLSFYIRLFINSMGSLITIIGIMDLTFFTLTVFFSVWSEREMQAIYGFAKHLLSFEKRKSHF